MPASNNVIWSLATGESHSHDDPVSAKLTATVTNHFEKFGPSDPQLVLMANSVTYTKLRRTLGLSNILGTLQSLKTMIWNEIEKATSDPEGNYIERGLADIKKDYQKSSFDKRIGKQQLQGQLLDLFLAGNIIMQYISG